MSDENRFSYVGIKPCGCMIAACVDKPEYKKDTAKSIAEWIREGLAVERVPITRVREMLATCRCNEPATTPSLFDEVTA